MDGMYRQNFNRFYFHTLSYKELLYDEATEEWYAQRDPDEVDRAECLCVQLGNFVTLSKSTENDFSPMYSFNHHHEL